MLKLFMCNSKFVFSLLGLNLGFYPDPEETIPYPQH
jgi:hypothetical protein